MFKKNLSLSTTYRIRYTINGMAWLVYSILRLFQNKVCEILGLVAIIVAIICELSFLKMGEREDEMAEKHFYKAKSFAFDIIYAIFLLIVIFSICGKGFLIKLDYVHGFVIAIINITIGILFERFEKAGD